MKKLIATAALLLAMSTPALAAKQAPAGPSASTTLYAGADITRTTPTGSDFTGGDVYVGDKVLKNLGIELGYGQAFNSANNDVKTVSLDAVGFVPVTQDVSILAIAGPTYNLTNSSKSTWGAEFGTGAQLALTKEVAIRGTVKYVDHDFTSATSPTALQYGAGLQLNF